MPSTELFSIAGKTAVVTGGSRGIGLMIARGYVEAGARVYISSRKADVCDSVAAELSASGDCYSVPADLSTEQGVHTLAAALGDREESLDILVNNAGAAWGAPFEEYPMSGFDRVFDLNVKAIFKLTQLCHPLLKKASRPVDPARVINIGSIDGFRVPAMANYAYSASKAAVHMLTRHLAKTLAPDGITVNAIAPGLFPSQMTAFLFDQTDVGSMIPLGRSGEPDDMAGVAIFLGSRASAFMTGSIVLVDGGSGVA